MTPPAAQRFLIGTYTQSLPHVQGTARGLLTGSIDPMTGELGAVEPLVDSDNPAYVVVSAAGATVYCTNETDTFDGAPGGGVSTFARDVGTGSLTAKGVRGSGGSAAAHLAISPSGRQLAVANYGGGTVAAFPIGADGALDAPSALVHHTGSSIDPNRQREPHPHMALFDPVTGDLLVPDLGTDAVVVYRMGDDGTLLEREDARLDLTPGSGPRHAVFSPDGQFLFVLTELTATVVVAERRDGRFVAIGSASMLPPEWEGQRSGAAIRVSPCGRRVYATNRGMNTIAVLAFDTGSRSLTLTQVVPTEGREPREFVLTPDGRFAIVANQDESTLVSFAVDDATGALERRSSTPAPTPVCLAWIPS